MNYITPVKIAPDEGAVKCGCVCGSIKAAVEGSREHRDCTHSQLWSLLIFSYGSLVLVRIFFVSAAMVTWKTDCIVRPLCNFFEKMGRFIGNHPWWFLIIPLILSAGLGSGFYFLNERVSNNIEEQFTPTNGPAKAERKYIEETFPGNDSLFSSFRLSTDGNYGTFIATNVKNILTVESLQNVLNLDLKIRSMEVKLDDKSFKYVDVCAEVNGSCFSNAILDIIQYDASNIDKVSLTYPWYQLKTSNIPLYFFLGSVTLKKDSSIIESAKALQLYYYLREDNKTNTDLWLESFINLMSEESSSSIPV